LQDKPCPDSKLSVDWHKLAELGCESVFYHGVKHTKFDLLKIWKRMKFRNIALVFALLTGLSGCADWIYRIDVPQGNFLDQKDVDKLRVNMTKEQVTYVLGNPVIEDAFDHDTWYYVYEMKRGMKKYGEDFRKELIIDFVDGKVATIRGDFKLSENFNTPLDN
jgi:outer membrane protein assembly factor BamE